MPTDDWQQIQDVFLAAADLPPEEQVRFLDLVCCGNAVLRGEVESLLAADRQGGDRIAAALEQAARSLVDADPIIDARFGPWRVVQPIGRGGMGTVYLAVRDDRQFEQRAALKLIRHGLDSEELLDRFRRERQILANLDHPYIARLLDGGSTPEGRPYLVLEYVEGQTIEAWVRDRDLPVTERCRLFLKVCEAVSHAHRNLVVHRDLKPANILITADGSPKLLDFGVAKLLAPDRPAGTSDTLAAQRPLTPEYASPEQILGEPVTTATDVYSLGAILYELLSGAKAHPIASPTPAEIERAVCHSPVTRPSSAVSPGVPAAARLRRQLAGDLDNIVLMAMRREPERRYSSVDQFAADIRRYLGGEPVAARKDSFGYRAGKFTRRHRLGLIAITLSVLSLVLGLVMAISQARQAGAARRVADSQREAAEAARLSAEHEHANANRERDVARTERSRAELEARRAETEALRARTEARRAEQRLTEMVALANHSLFDIHSQIERLPGATEARRRIVRTTLQYLEELSKDAADDERLQRMVGAAYVKLGQVQGYPYGPSLRDYPAALKSLQAAESLLAPLVRSHPDNADILTDWLEVQRHTALVLDASGKSADAVALIRAALPDAARLARLRPDKFEALRPEVSLLGSAAVALGHADTTEALRWARRYVDGAARLAGRFPDQENAHEDLSDAHAVTGTLLGAVDLKAAAAEFEESAAQREKIYAAHPDDALHRRSLMLAYAHVAAILGNPVQANIGDFEGARKYYAKVVKLAEQNAAADPRDRTARYDVAASLLRLGMVEAPPSGLPASLENLQRAAGMLDSLSAASPDDLSFKRETALAQEFIGNRLRDLGRLPEAIGAYRRSLESAESTLAARPTDRAAHSQAMAARRGIVLALAMSGDREGALAEARASIDRARAAIPVGSDRNLRTLYLARNLVALGSAYRIFAKAASSPAAAREDWKEARAAAARAVAELETVPDAGKNRLFSPYLAEARALIAECDAQ